MFVAIKKKSVSSSTMKGKVLKPMRGFTLGVHGIQHNHGVVTTVVICESI